MEVLSMRTVRSNREHSLSVGAQHELTITITILIHNHRYS